MGLLEPEPVIDDGLYGCDVLNGLLDWAAGSGLKADRACSVFGKYEILSAIIYMNELWSYTYTGYRCLEEWWIVNPFV